MLHLIDEALAGLLHKRLGNDIEISFRAPDSEWSGGISRPTVNLYLWDLRPTDEAGSGIETIRDGDGRLVRRAVRPRMLFRYLATAWASDPRDEHNLLGSLATMLSLQQEMPVDLLPAPLDEIRPLPMVSLSLYDAGDRADFWNALGGRFHAGLDVQVVATVDPQATWDVGPLAVTVETEVVDHREADRRSRRRRVGGVVHDPAAIGSIVRTEQGTSRVGDDGRFSIVGDPGAEVVVESDPPRRAVIPADGIVEFA